MGYSRFWLKMADVESKSIPHELPSSHWLKATGQCVLERYLSATMGLNYIFFMPPTLKKWGTYWFRLVRMYVCVYSCSRYRLVTSCMDSSWKNSRRIFLVFPELSPLVKLRPFDKQGDEILYMPYLERYYS